MAQICCSSGEPMCPSFLQRTVVAAIACVALFAPEAVAGEPRIVCPVSGGPARAAQAIFVYGSLQDPWGELSAPPREERKDGSVVHRYPLPSESGAEMPHKWLICYYGDSSYRAVGLPRTTKECAILSQKQDLDPKTRKPRYLVQDISCK